MPTGYTADVQSGKITEFTEFAMQCARGIGALMMMRDEPLSAPIPARFEPETAYYDKGIVEAEARLAELRAMSLPTIREAAQQDHAAKMKAEDDYITEKNERRERYEAMLAKVEAWQPPTPDHVGFKDFMTEQLRESIKFDCSPGGYYGGPPKKMEPDEWFAAEIAKADRDVDYKTKERAKEIERTESRNRWLADLRSSLDGGRP